MVRSTEENPFTVEKDGIRHDHSPKAQRGIPEFTATLELLHFPPSVPLSNESFRKSLQLTSEESQPKELDEIPPYQKDSYDQQVVQQLDTKKQPLDLAKKHCNQSHPLTCKSPASKKHTKKSQPLPTYDSDSRYVPQVAQPPRTLTRSDVGVPFQSLTVVELPDNIATNTTP